MKNTTINMRKLINRIIHKESNNQVLAKTWKCSKCKTMYHSELGRPLPSPCKMCGGIGFEKVE